MSRSCNWFPAALLSVLLTAAPALASDDHKTSPGQILPQLKLTSTVLRNAKPVPKQYTGDGKDISPPFAWGTVPASTQSMALICDDPDAPAGNWTHWVIFNIPGTATGLAEAIKPVERLADGTLQGTNSWKKLGYNGPAPPRRQNHRYIFKVFAVDKMLDLKAGVTRDQLIEAIKGHVLAEGQLVATYSR